jgi:hypothetical protein
MKTYITRLIQFFILENVLFSLGQVPKDFLSQTYFSSNTIETNPALFDQLEKYVQQHRIETILNEQGTEAFCQRKFIVATYACPQAIGNHLVFL